MSRSGLCIIGSESISGGWNPRLFYFERKFEFMKTNGQGGKELAEANIKIHKPKENLHPYNHICKAVRFEEGDL